MNSGSVLQFAVQVTSGRCQFQNGVFSIMEYLYVCNISECSISHKLSGK
jgi:hypothetical protein